MKDAIQIFLVSIIKESRFIHWYIIGDLVEGRYKPACFKANVKLLLEILLELIITAIFCVGVESEWDLSISLVIEKQAVP